jgi:hypothetical protein
MNAASYLVTPFEQPKIEDSPVMIALPQAVGHGDEAMIFRSWLLRTQGDGCELRSALDKIVRLHPEIAAKIIAAGSLGRVQREQAVGALRTYMIHKVAQAPVITL